MLLIFLSTLVVCVQSFTPLVPTHGYTYSIEAARAKSWPSCPYRFLSFSENSNVVDLWSGAGANQHWQLLDSGDGTFFLKTNFGQYLSYSGDCNSQVIDLWGQAGVNQKFRFVVGDNTQFEYYIEAVGRSQCSHKYASFLTECTTNTPDKLDLWSAAGSNQRFRIYPVASTNPVVHKVGTSFTCPDPYVWKPQNSAEYLIQCTGGGLRLGHSKDLNPATSQFDYLGDCLSGTPASWAAETAGDSRWAPENYETPDGKSNYIIFSDTQPDGKHRIGWVLSTSGAVVGGYNKYAPSFLDLGMAAGGDIDSTVFTDSDGRTYLVWKTDDNSVGSTTTRIWAQQLVFANETVAQVGSPVVLMDSTGLWWVDSWTEGGSLVEGPEVVLHNNMYYLFFAAGKYCQDTYTQGVARSKSLLGPYEKMATPVLTNGIVGTAASPSTGKVEQLVGPGHATFAQTAEGDWRIIWHASVGQNCDRRAFISELVFGADGWPYVNM